MDIPEVITQDRSNVHGIIEEMLETPDEHRIYQTTRAFNKLERLIDTARMEAVGWAWAEACVQLDRKENPREYEMGQLITRASTDLNPPWEYQAS